MDDIDLRQIGTMRRVAVFSSSEEDRVQKIGVYIRDALDALITNITVGIKFSPAISDDLAKTLLEHAAIVTLSHPDIDEETTVEDARAFATFALGHLAEMLRARREEAAS